MPAMQLVPTGGSTYKVARVEARQPEALSTVGIAATMLRSGVTVWIRSIDRQKLDQVLRGEISDDAADADAR